MAETATAPVKPNSGPGAETKPAETKPAGDTKPAPETKPAATTTEEKPGEQPAKTPAGKDDTATPESKVPEKYTLTLPDGGRIDDHDLATIEALARESNWSNEEAQARLEAHAEFIESHSQAFRTITESDPVYGGRHLEETTKFADAALNKIRPKGTPHGDAFRALLFKSGYDNNLEVVAFLADLGKSWAEDGTAGGGGATPESDDIATALYGPDKT
jgi:hypothetical protein